MDYKGKFIFQGSITQEHIDFFNTHGFIQFKNFYTNQEIDLLLKAVEDVEKKWLTDGLEKVNGTPIKFGKDENGKPIVQRYAFTSLFSDYIKDFLKDHRIQELKRFIGNEARIAENEKDGVVVNHFINTGESEYSKLGWHTDGLRDVFNGFKLEPMLNIGIYMDDSPIAKGGLRVLPGTHNQNIYNLLFRKKYFVDNNPDKDEVAIEAEKGDLTVHHGRIWHRVALSNLKGAESKRRVMYFPIIKGKYKPKTENTRTPFYHKFQKFIK